MNFTETE